MDIKMPETLKDIIYQVIEDYYEFEKKCSKNAVRMANMGVPIKSLKGFA